MVSKMRVSKIWQSRRWIDFWLIWCFDFTAEYVESRAATVKNDRAAQRRQKVGSSCDFEKTKTASLDT